MNINNPNGPGAPMHTIAFERSGVYINGLVIGVHDLLMMALSTLKKKERTREIAVTITELEKVIAYHQSTVGIEDGAQMKPLSKDEPQPPTIITDFPMRDAYPVGYKRRRRR